MMPLILAKVGGSLYDLPDLGDRLRRWLAPYPYAILFPGGGAMADVVRDFDQCHRLGEEAAHWLALRALSLNAHFLAQLLPEARIVTGREPGEAAGWAILDPLPFFVADEANADHLPHVWDVTSDSLAVRAGRLLGAREVVLLKSVVPTRTWTEAAAAGHVDPYLLRTWTQDKASPFWVRMVNLRDAS